MEIWKDVKDYEGLYAVSNYGKRTWIKTKKECYSIFIKR